MSEALSILSVGAGTPLAIVVFTVVVVGCIQALRCQTNTCPTGITTHNPRLWVPASAGTTHAAAGKKVVAPA